MADQILTADGLSSFYKKIRYICKTWTFSLKNNLSTGGKRAEEIMKLRNVDYVTGTRRQKKNGPMKEQFKAPENIQLSDEEIANLSDAQVKTLVIRKLTELVEFGRKIDEKMKLLR